MSMNMADAAGVPAFQSLVIDVGWFGVRYTASLDNGLLLKGWDEADEARWNES
jgi:hypothetical protein